MSLSKIDKVIIEGLSQRFKAIKPSSKDIEEEDIGEEEHEVYREDEDISIPRTFAARGQANLEANKLTMGVGKPELTKEEQDKIKTKRESDDHLQM